MEDETLGVFGKEWYISNIPSYSAEELQRVYKPRDTYRQQQQEQELRVRGRRAAAELIDDLSSYGPHYHPIFRDEIIDKLLAAADSKFPEVRRQALKHQLFPEAKTIMMVGDSDEGVRELAERILQWKKAQPE